MQDNTQDRAAPKQSVTSSENMLFSYRGCWWYDKTTRRRHKGYWHTIAKIVRARMKKSWATKLWRIQFIIYGSMAMCRALAPDVIITSQILNPN